VNRKFCCFLLLAGLATSGVSSGAVAQPVASDASTTHVIQLLGALSPEQKRRAEQLTSIFENDELEFQYGYVEALDDGRGITAGRVGFTTGTGDAYEVVKRYAAAVPGNPLARFLPELARLTTAEKKDDVSHLKGFKRAWRQAAQDARFRAVQDEVTDELYYLPMTRYAELLGLRTALAKAALYDALIQHGNGEDPDGVPALLEAAAKAAGGTPKKGVQERSWLHSFLLARRADLLHATDEATRKAWAESVGRVDAFLQIEAGGNYDLQGPIRLNTREFSKIVP